MNTKKVIIICAVLLTAVIIAAVVLTVISSKGSLSGKYSDVEIGIGTTLEFDGNSVKVTYMSNGEVVTTAEGTYKVSDGTISFSLDRSTPYVASDIYEFSLDDGKITIDGKEYKRAE